MESESCPGTGFGELLESGFAAEASDPEMQETRELVYRLPSLIKSPLISLSFCIFCLCTFCSSGRTTANFNITDRRPPRGASDEEDAISMIPTDEDLVLKNATKIF